MTMMVRAPDIDDTVKPTLFKLVAVIRDIRCKISVESVSAAQNIVLIAAEVGRAQPKCAVLGFIGRALRGQHIDGFLHIAAVVQLTLAEPDVVVDLIPLEVALHAGDIGRQAVALDHGKALLRGLVQQAVAVLLDQIVRQRPDILALIPRGVEFDRILAAQLLNIAPLHRMGKLIYLIACVVDIKLTRNIVARPVEHLAQAVTEYAAACVAHMHRAGGVGGNELNHDLFRLLRLRAAVVRTHLQYIFDRLFIPALVKREIHKAGSGNFHRIKAAARQIQMLHNRLRDLAGCGAQRFGTLHGKGGCPVAVRRILRGLHRNGRNVACGQHTRLHSFVVCRFDHTGRFGARKFICVHLFTLRYFVIAAQCRAAHFAYACTGSVDTTISK